MHFITLKTRSSQNVWLSAWLLISLCSQLSVSETVYTSYSSVKSVYKDREELQKDGAAHIKDIALVKLCCLWLTEVLGKANE